jgi:hypothetical protein
VRSRLVGTLAGRLGIAAAVGGALLGMDPLDGAAGPLSDGPLGRVAGLGAESQLGIGDVVIAPVLLDLGRGLPPGPPTPRRLRHRPQRRQDIAGPVGFDGEAGGAPLPGQGPHHLPILGAEVRVGLQPTIPALLVLAQLPLPIVGPVNLLGGHRQPTWDLRGLFAAPAQPAEHAGRLAARGRLVGGRDFLGLLTVDGGPGQLPAAITGGPVKLTAEPVPLSP